METNLKTAGFRSLATYYKTTTQRREQNAFKKLSLRVTELSISRDGIITIGIFECRIAQSAHLFRLVIDGLFSLLSPKLEEVTGVGVKLQSVSPVIPGWLLKEV